MGQQNVFRGFPVPIHCITPNMLYYPLAIPSEYVLLNDNDFPPMSNKRDVIKISHKDHLRFIETLMHLLNRKYIILYGYFLVDLNRNDFHIVVDELLRKITIIPDRGYSRITGLRERYWKNKIDWERYDNQQRTQPGYILKHCKRIVNNTNKILKYIVNI